MRKQGTRHDSLLPLRHEIIRRVLQGAAAAVLEVAAGRRDTLR
jgi:hypothetical protein